jgi:hypothetical protein
MGIPEPHLYIQSIAADFGRVILYCFTYPAEFVVRFDLSTRLARRLAYIGNAIMFAQPHNGVVDRNGRLWGTYAETRAWDENTGPCPIRLFRYDPDTDLFDWYEHGLSRRNDPNQLVSDPTQPYKVVTELEGTRHKNDFGFCDAMAYDGGRYIYAGTVAGVLCRIDIETAEVVKVARVMAAGRFPALTFDGDGALYGAGGMKGQTQVIRWDPATNLIEDFGEIVESTNRDRPARIHEIAVANDGSIYLAENDNHERSSYLWRIQR